MVDTPNLHWQESKDLAQIKAWDRERYFLQMQRHRLYFVQQASAAEGGSGVSRNIYGEPVEGAVTDDGPDTAAYSDPVVDLPVYINREIDQKTADKWGLNRTSDILVVFSIAVLEGLGIDFRDITKGPKIGDRIDFMVEGSIKNQYELRTAEIHDFWGNTQYPLHVVCAANLTHEPLTS